MDALASRVDEGRGRLRKVKGSCQQTLILKYPNGETQLLELLISEFIADKSQPSELKYLSS